MQIFIKTLNGNSIIINVNSTDTIISIKNKIREKEGVPIEIQRLTYNKNLINEKTLSDYNIQNGSNILLLLSLKSNS